IAEQRGYGPDAATALYNLGNLSLASGDMDGALDFHQRALKIRQVTGDQRGTLRSLNRVGVALERRGDLNGCGRADEQASGQFEKIGAHISDPVQFGEYRRTSLVLYPHYALVLAKLGKMREALVIAERSRGVGLSRLTALNGASFVDLLSAEEREAWRGVTAR